MSTDDFEFEEIDLKEKPVRNKPKGKTKICRYCKEEIRANAKVCRYCHKKQGSGCLVWIVGALIIMFILPTMLGSNENENKKQQVMSKNYTVGETVEFNDVTINYLSAEKYVSDNQFIVPSEGTEYYKIGFEFINNGKSDITISSMVNWTCYADDYKVNQTWIDTDNDLSGTLSSGKKIKGYLYFEIPLDAKSVTLEYKDNVWIDDKLVFIIK